MTELTDERLAAIRERMRVRLARSEEPGSVYHDRELLLVEVDRLREDAAFRTIAITSLKGLVVCADGQRDEARQLVLTLHAHPGMQPTKAIVNRYREELDP